MGNVHEDLYQLHKLVKEENVLHSLPLHISHSNFNGYWINQLHKQCGVGNIGCE